MVKISIVVPAFNEEAGLPATLASIRAASAAFDRAGWTTELIVCDNNSSDRTADVARRAGAKVVFEPVNQIGRARNTGASHAAGDWLIFVDADSHPGVGLFEDVVSVIRRGRCLAGGTTITFDSGLPFVHASARVWNTVSRINRWAAGSFIFCEAAAFRQLGGFNLELFAGEEIDLFRRLKRAARAARRTIVILHRRPLITSDRKARLYSVREVVRLMLRMVVAQKRTLRSVDECYVWYDGRR